MKKILAALTFIWLIQIQATASEPITWEGVNKLAFDLVKYNYESNINMLYSPISFYETMGMLYAGTDENTAKLMEEKLHFSRKGFHKNTGRDIFTIREKGKMYMSIYNSIWLQKTLEPKSKFTRTLQKNYGFDLRVKDFIAFGYNSADQINRYIENATRKKVKNILTKNDVDANTRLLALSGINFYLDLGESFDVVGDVPFNGGNTVKMAYKKGDRLFYEDEKYKAISIAYEKNLYNIIFVLPKGEIEDFVKESLTANEYNKMEKYFSTRNVSVTIPILSFDKAFNCNETLRHLGLKELMEPTADYSALVPEKIKLDQMIQKIKFEFTGKGGSRGLKVGVIKNNLSDKVREFRLDKPFVFIVKENKTSAIMFIGLINKLEK